MKPIKFVYIFLIILASFWAIKPLVHSGFFPMHDDTQVVRVSQMAEALKDGQFPVRWVKDLGYGYGYPIFNFYAPLAYYIGAFFVLIGFNALLATKIMFGLAIVFSGIFMYFLAKEFWGDWGGLIAGIFYIYAPYHAVDIYVRGAVGEIWVYAFLPLVFLGIWNIFKNKLGGILIGVVGLAGVILSHNLTAMMLAPFVVLAGIIGFVCSERKRQFIISFLLFAILAAGIASFYWLPALWEMKLTKVAGQVGGGADFRNHFLYLDQLWASPWGFAGSGPGRLDGMSFMIGKFHILLALISLVFMTKFSIFAFCYLLFAVFMSLGYSRFIWEAVKPMAYLQYPWRFLVMATFFVSFLTGVAKRFPRVVGLILILILIIFSQKYFRPQNYLKVTVEDYLALENIIWKTSKISDEYLPKDFPVPENQDQVAWQKIDFVNGQAEIRNIKMKSQQYDLLVDSSDSSEVQINLAYFPGWQVRLNGQIIKPVIKQGKIILLLPVGKSIVGLKFTNTPIRTYANTISLVSFLAVFLIFFRKRSSEK